MEEFRIGTIEEYWEDITVYSVEFSSILDPNGTRKFRRVLVFPSSITKEDVFHLVPVYLRGIEQVLYVDELEDGLLLKERHH